MSNRKLVFHIGHAKTATTYLQHCLALNGERLSGAGFFSPSNFAPLGGHDLHVLAKKGREFSGNAQILFFRLKDGDDAVLNDYLRMAPNDKNLVLSSELFFYYPELIGRVCDFFRNAGFGVEIVSYIPRYEKAVVSGYLQNVRNHYYRGGVREFLIDTAKIKYFRFAEVLNSIEERCSPDAMKVKTFDARFWEGGEIFEDFLAAAGVSERRGYIRPEKSVYESLPLAVFEVIRLMNDPKNEGILTKLRVSPNEIDRAERDRIFNFYFTQQVKSYIEQNFRDDRIALIETWFKDSREEALYWRERLAPERADPLTIREVEAVLKSI